MKDKLKAFINWLLNIQSLAEKFKIIKRDKLVIKSISDPILIFDEDDVKSLRQIINYLDKKDDSITREDIFDYLFNFLYWSNKYIEPETGNWIVYIQFDNNILLTIDNEYICWAYIYEKLNCRGKVVPLKESFVKDLLNKLGGENNEN